MKIPSIFIIGTALTTLISPSIVMGEELVHTVEDAYYRITDTNPPQLQVTATGMVPTSGWSFPKLRVYAKQKPPAQGVLEYDFVADAPDADRLLIEQEMPIHTNNLLHDYYPSITAIKINAKNNHKLIEIEQSEK